MSDTVSTNMKPAVRRRWGWWLTAAGAAAVVVVALEAIMPAPALAEWISPGAIPEFAMTLALGGMAAGLVVSVWRRSCSAGRWRTASTLALLTLAWGAWAIIGLFVAAPYRPGVVDYFFPLFVEATLNLGLYPVNRSELALDLSVVGLGLFIAGAVTWRCGARVRHGLVALALALPVYVYLARDDAEWRDPIELAEFAPPGAEAIQANEVLLRCARGSESAKAFVVPKIFADDSLPQPINSAEWVAFVAAKRGELASAWAEMLPVREWWAEWSRYPAVADTTNDFFSPIPDFRLIRAYGRAVCAEATARALEGRGDEAIGLLLPLIEGAGKMQAHSVLMVRGMIAVVLRGMAADTAGVVIERGGGGAATRERLRSALAATVTGESGARRLINGEFALQLCQFRRMEQTRSPGLKGWLVGVVSAVYFNPRRTYNEIGEVAAKMAEYAARRDDVRVGAVVNEYLESVRKRPGIKNPFGRGWAADAMPDYGKPVARYWKTEDATVALIARLDAMAAAGPAAAVKEEKP